VRLFADASTIDLATGLAVGGGFRNADNLSIDANGNIYIIEDPSPNAFATGRDPQHASVAVTTGLLLILEKTELEGVIAHELAHVKNYDIRVMMLVVVLVGTLSIIGDQFLRFGLGGRRRSRDSGGGLFAILGIIFLILAPLIGELVKLAISRSREYLADADGALLTRYPEGLANALEKISTAGIPMARTSSATNHLWISEPSPGGWRAKFSGLLSTHPPIADRIAKLRQMTDNT